MASYRQAEADDVAGRWQGNIIDSAAALACFELHSGEGDGLP